MFHLYYTEIDNVTYRQTLNDINEIGIPVITAASKLFHMSSPLLRVLVSAVSAVRRDQHPTGAEQSEDDGVPLDERGSLFGGVDEGGWESSTVGDRQLQTDGCGSLVVRRRVVGEPDEDGRYCTWRRTHEMSIKSLADDIETNSRAHLQDTSRTPSRTAHHT
jgi:hypothetical protein